MCGSGVAESREKYSRSKGSCNGLEEWWSRACCWEEGSLASRGFGGNRWDRGVGAVVVESPEDSSR